MALTNKQRVFVAEYLKDFNATRAAEASGYTHPNKQGPRLLVNVGIATEIERIIAERCMGPDETLLRLAEQARAAYSEYVTEDGTVNMAGLVQAGKAHPGTLPGCFREVLPEHFQDASRILPKILPGSTSRAYFPV